MAFQYREKLNLKEIGDILEIKTIQPYIKKLIEKKVILVEEEILIKKVLAEDAPANATGAAVSTNEPKIEPKSKKKPIMGMARRPALAVKEVC